MIAPLSIPSPDPVWQVWEIPLFGWVIPIHTYALCILLGMVVALIWTSRRLTKRGGEPGVVLDVALWAIILGIIGARFYHVFTHPGDFFYEGANPWEVFAIWNGGNAIFGSLIGGAVGVFIGCKITGLRFWSFADALAPALLAAQALGRLGNWFNHELFGLPTDLPWGLEIESTNPAFPAGLAEGTLFHPTFLYEMIWNVIGIALIVWLERKLNLRWGRALAVYLIWYGLGRSFLESIRVDPSELFLGIRSNVWASFAAIAIGIIILIVQGRRHTGLEPSVYVPGREWHAPDPDVDSDDTDSAADETTDETDVAAEKAEAAATSTSGTPSQERSTPTP